MHIFKPLIILCILSDSIFAQSEITGYWYSEDRKRVYLIKKINNDIYEALLEKSNRLGEPAGGNIIWKDVFFNKKKGRYEGIMFSVKENYLPRLATAKYNQNDQTLEFVLPRLYFFPVSIKWIR